MSEDIPIEVHIVHGRVGDVTESIMSGAVPLKIGVGGPTIGSAKRNQDGTVTAVVTVPEIAKKLSGSVENMSMADVSNPEPVETYTKTVGTVRMGVQINEKPIGTIPQNTEGYSDQTLLKVRDALHKGGMNNQQIERAITEMQNHGILFRERM